jgi:hypothetical protein
MYHKNKVKFQIISRFAYIIEIMYIGFLQTVRGYLAT